MTSMKSGFGILGGVALLMLGAGLSAPAEARDLTAPVRLSIEETMREQAEQAVREAMKAQASGETDSVRRAAEESGEEPRAAVAASVTSTFKCLPTCSTTDGRFLAIAGTGFATLSPPELELAISVPAGSTSFDIGIFDGDGGEYDPPGDPSGEANWDSGLTALFEYELFADPDADGVGLTPVDLEPGSPTIFSPDMPDNAWRDFTVPTGPDAQSPSGNYFYVLKISLSLPTTVTLNAFKVRTSAVLSGLTLDPVARPFSYVAPWTALSDLSIVYPAYPSTTPTNYDGTFRFFFDVAVSQDEITVWDGDFDHGKFNGTEPDTDDPDTPPLFLPPWATLDTLPESAKGTGSPADDRSPTGVSGTYSLKPPSVRYELSVPGGPVLPNDNPSGNVEWERFTLSTDPLDPSEMDYSLPSIPPGTYRLDILGVDMNNLNALLLPFRVLCVDEAGVPCVPLRPFLVGDTVFFDQNGNGAQDPGEEGVEGVTLELYDSHGLLLGATATDADGHYSFGVDNATYEVVVVASNFTSGPLVGYDSTTGGDSQTNTVDGDNELGYDFGYRGTGSVGDRIWSDTNGDGIQDGGEAGLNGVTVELLDGEGNVVDSTTTSVDGDYSFDNLGSGTFTVRVVSSTLPAGFSPTFDADGTGTPNEATVTLEPGDTNDGVDFGYQGSGSVGDRVWNDLDGDGVQEGGEAGLNGVTVRLIDSGGNVVATTVTAGDGNYSFTGVVVGAYTVSVDGASLPAGFNPTFDSDGIGTPNQAAVTVTAGGNVETVDFGYRATPKISLGDRVWSDSDGDGVQDGTETGLNGVTVQLLNSGGTVIATQVTAGNGNYSFTNLDAGTYSVRVVTATLPAGATPTYDADGTGTPHIATVTASANNANVDFGYQPAAVCTAGYFKDHFNTASFSNNDGTLSWTGAWIESDVAGPGVSSGNVTVGTPVSGYMIFRDSPDTGTQPSAARQANLSGFASATLTVSFHIRGVETDDAVVIEASNNGGSSYTVLETLTGYTGTYISSRTFDISAFIASNTRIRFRVTGNYGGSDDFFKVDWVKLDAGCTPPSQTGSIGNRVWKDVDGDGVQDSGEPGLNGVTVQLLNSAGTVIATQVTSGDGSYSFSSLAAGTYKVKVASGTPSGYTQTYDLDGTGTAHIATVTLAAGQNRTDADFGYRPPAQQPGTGTLGYWKNHSEAWPVSSITIGGRTYSKSQAISLMGTSGKGDKTYDMFKQLVAAKLNVLIGNDSSCISATISAADSWMGTYPVGSKVSSSSSAWAVGGPLHQKLDDYNNGRLCAPHRD